MIDGRDSDGHHVHTDRAVSAVVEQTLAIGLVVLYISLVVVTFYGGVLPDFRTAAGERIGDRTLATASQRVQQAVPPNATNVERRTRVNLPATIRGDAYDIETDGRSLILDHPDPVIGTRARLALPSHVTRVDGRWESGEQAVIVVRRVGDSVVVRLETGGER